jgi:hypothetical protein
VLRYAPGSAPYAPTRADPTRVGARLPHIETPRSDPFLDFLDAAPLDDEPVSADEAAAVAEVAADRAAGVPTIPFDEIKRDYGRR